ncbi:hypothetical protein L2089_07995 [Paenibacillus hunanensis]|uniref:hypothetical protein n=1 Tax=Paenibacillus hunanensis TaxID=539262 RepID=UPI00202758DA|nr:hypothetical protein [Paenibacillus hunanensis]MCL9660622.1 hypothetical protein [Paenibacillus hunanensis]
MNRRSWFAKPVCILAAPGNEEKLKTYRLPQTQEHSPALHVSLSHFDTPRFASRAKKDYFYRNFNIATSDDGGWLMQP